MPTAALRPCSTCHQLGCTQHVRPAWGHAQETPRIRGRKLQQLRRQLFADQPWCVQCLAQQPPLQTLATIRDHIIPLAEGGQDIASNTQGLCQDCSDVKTQQEAERGKVRWR